MFYSLIFNKSPLAIAPTAQKRGIKNLLCIFAFGKKTEKIGYKFHL